MEKEKLIEGKRREIGKSKVWRLSKEGRELTGAAKVPLPFSSPKVEHVLAIGDVYQALVSTGRLLAFHYEPKDEFNAGRRLVYSPDAFYALRGGGAALLEVQRSPMSSTRWAAKWAIASAYFEGGHYKGASWQPGKLPIIPRIVVLSSQEEETIKAGSMLNITIARTIEEAL